jgi:acyl-CoA thioester hydrolase
MGFVWKSVDIRFSDEDNMGHVFHSRIVEYVAEARIGYIDNLIEESGEDVDHTLAHLVMDFIREIHYPGSVDVGLGIAKIGNKSLTTGYILHVDGQLVAEASCVSVFFDIGNNKTCLIPEGLRILFKDERN